MGFSTVSASNLTVVVMAKGLSFVLCSLTSKGPCSPGWLVLNSLRSRNWLELPLAATDEHSTPNFLCVLNTSQLLPSPLHQFSSTFYWKENKSHNFNKVELGSLFPIEIYVNLNIVCFVGGGMAAGTTIPLWRSEYYLWEAICLLSHLTGLCR